MPKLPLVLVVDDLPQNVELVGEYLSDFYEIQCAFSGLEALALTANNLPDLILLDVMMPEMDGYSVCDSLKKNPATRSIPVIFVTAKNDSESESKALLAGAVDFIHKPINRDVLRARVQLHLTLKAREQELSQLNSELEQQVEERTQALRDALIRAESAHQAKNLFLSNVNHELRTPMNAIIGLTHLLCQQIDDPKMNERAKRISHSGEQLLSLIDDIIMMADLQAGKIELKSLPFHLPTLFKTVIANWQSKAQDKGLTLSLELDPQLATTYKGDGERLQQILDNLISNAIKFSVIGDIRLKVNRPQRHTKLGWIRVQIQDQGLGITPDKLVNIFNVFEQTDNSSTRGQGGIGLGLAICRQLTELMGGNIDVESTIGTGSSFQIELPMVELSDASYPSNDLHLTQTLAVETPVSPTSIDRQSIRQVYVPLVGLLAAGDIKAYMLWERSGQVLESLLEERSLEFNNAMTDFDFPLALKILQSQSWQIANKPLLNH